MLFRGSILAGLSVLLLGSAVDGQVYSTPTTRPAISAADREWFLDARPIVFAGDLYYPGGSRYHFDANVMVETGSYDGVPLYADTTVAAYDEVLVPIGGGLVQPYERRRTGQLAGTTGSHTPDYPVDVVPWEARPVEAPQAGGRRSQQPAPTDLEARAPRASDEEARQRLMQLPGRIETIRVPDDNRGIWIRYEGERWNAAHRAVAHDSAKFSKIGEYFGFPVFSTSGQEEIYLPGADGMLAAYKKDGR